MATLNSINTSLSGQSGTGSFAGTTSPTFVTPTLGAASATTINKITFTSPASGSTITIADGKTFSVSNTLTFTGTDSSSVAFGAGGTVSYTVVDSWVAYTPTFTALGTVTTIAIYSRRVGSNLEIMGRFTTGTVTASQAQMTLGYNGSNGNVTSSNIVIPTLITAGNAVSQVAFAGAIYVNIAQNVGYINFGIQNGTNSALAQANGSTVFNNNSLVSIQCSVPISGW